MGFYSYLRGEDDEPLSPEEKAEYVSLLWNKCLSRSPSMMFKAAEVHDVLPDLVKKAGCIDDDKSKYDKLKMNRSNEQNITSFFYKLSYTNLNEAIDTIHLLASASLTDLNRMLKPIVYDPDWVKLTLLLVIALPLLLCPPIDAWSIDNTPVSRFLSSLSSYGPAQGRRLNEARTVVTSVWEASQNLCKMHFIVRLIPSSGVEEPFPRVMRDYFKQYIDAHSFEAHTPRKRAKYEP